MLNGRVDVNPTNYFVFFYRVPDGAPEHSWEIVELYHHLRTEDAVTVATNCLHMIPMMRSSGWFSFLMTMIENKIKEQQRHVESES